MAKLKVDDTLLEAAILGLQLKGLLIDEKIAELQGVLANKENRQSPQRAHCRHVSGVG
jgi:hypothetical protein